MSSSREALQSRFRANLEKRIKNVGALLEVLEFIPGEPEARRQVLGELHTLKGESRMLGLVDLADRAHAMEEMLESSEELDFPQLGAAVQALGRALGTPSAGGGDGSEGGAARHLRGRAVAPRDGSPDDVSGEKPSPGLVSREDESTREDGGRRTERWVQVEATTVDRLCERVTELAANFGRLQHVVNGEFARQGGHSEKSSTADAFERHRELLDACVDATWGLRLVGVEPMLRELERHARLLARRADRQLDVLVHASGVQLERDVVDLVWDSLLHLVRNSLAHGLEDPSERGEKPAVGHLRLIAESAGPNVVITVADDGRGIDPVELRRAAVHRQILSEGEARLLSDDEAVQLVFRHGFSTERQVDDLSGRGVGLDVVKDKIEGLGGTVELLTEVGQGTRFVLTVPFAITKERMLVIDSGSGLYGMPSRVVQAVLGSLQLREVGADGVVRYGDTPVPLRSFAAAAGLPAPAQEEVALVLKLGGRLFAIRVLHIVAERELIRRPAETLLSRSTGIGASAVLNDGELVLLLDLGFLERALSRGAALAPLPPAAAVRQTHVVVADDSPVVTEMVAELLTSAGFSVEVARDGLQALAAIERREPDLVLSDLEMPNMNGLELLTAIRKRSQTLPVVMLTTRGSVEDRQRASALGANAYVLKSGFRSDVLLEVVSRFLRVRP
jgi:chemotaxis protein histidine kinase CheA